MYLYNNNIFLLISVSFYPIYSTEPRARGEGPGTSHDYYFSPRATTRMNIVGNINYISFDNNNYPNTHHTT